MIYYPSGKRNTKVGGYRHWKTQVTADWKTDRSVNFVEQRIFVKFRQLFNLAMIMSLAVIIS